MPKLIDIRMADGSRHFADAGFVAPVLLVAHLRRVPGLTVTDVLDTPVEAWIDFTYRGHRFTMNNPLNEYSVFVEDPACPEAVLSEVASYVQRVR